MNVWCASVVLHTRLTGMPKARTDISNHFQPAPGPGFLGTSAAVSERRGSNHTDIEKSESPATKCKKKSSPYIEGFKRPGPQKPQKNWDFFYWTFGIPRAFLAKPQSRWSNFRWVTFFSMSRKLYKEMKSRCRAIKLCKTLYLWRDDRYRSSTNQSWITRDRCTAVKSFN